MNNLIVVLLIILIFLYNFKIAPSSANINESFIDSSMPITYNKIVLTKPTLPSSQYYFVAYSQLAFVIQTKINNLILSGKITINKELNNINDLEYAIKTELNSRPKNDILFAVEKSFINLSEIIKSSSFIIFNSNNKPQYLMNSSTSKSVASNVKNNLSHNNTILFINTSPSTNIATINNNNIISNFNDNTTSKLIELVPITFLNEKTRSPLYLVSLTNSNDNNYDIITEEFTF